MFSNIMYVKVINQYSYWDVHKILLFLSHIARDFNMGVIFQSSFKVINKATEECWVCVSQFLKISSLQKLHMILHFILH
jgi:hypothetical protein